MASVSKEKTIWFCKECGNESSKWLGKCPACGEWNTMTEHKITNTPVSARHFAKNPNKPLQITEINFEEEDRFSLGNSEIDRLLGGGIVRGSLILIAGEPGIGKSTLSLQIPLHCAGLKTLYISGEESVKQVKMRADRIGGTNPDCYIMSETLIEKVIETGLAMSPSLMIVDSVQTMYSERVESSAGAVPQIKEVTSSLLTFAKNTNIPVVLIGHITKDGYIAGPKILEHIVDVVLHFEGEDKSSYRLLRSLKNRFGSTSELGVFEMTSTGLKEIKNPSEMLLPMHDSLLSGTSVCAMIDGMRPFLFEVQALVSSAIYGTAQRTATGFDVRRLNMLLAVLEKRAGFKLNTKDVFLNMAGGIKVNDPACDLSVAASVLSSNFDYPIDGKFCFAGEIGLSGEIRPVNHTDKRIIEAERLGFKKIFISSFSSLSQKPGIETVKIPDVPSLVKNLFK